MLRLLRTLVVLSTAVLLSGTVQAATAPEKRVALVVGMSRYVHVPPLANTANDARLMADTLQSLGFKLVGGKALIDLDKKGLEQAIRSFGEQLTASDVGLFYYAGHGIQMQGVNYLVPVGANPVRQADVDFELIDAGLLLRQMEASGAKLNLMILDACRNNPFGTRGLRDLGGGLAQMRAPRGTLISYATQPGNVAMDSLEGGKNSPYTKTLAEAMRTPGLDVLRLFNEVGLIVDQETNGAQQPWMSSSPIAGDFYFAGSSSPLPPATVKVAPTTSPAPPVVATTTPSTPALSQQIVPTNSVPAGSITAPPTSSGPATPTASPQQQAMLPPGTSNVAPTPTVGRYDGEWRGSAEIEQSAGSCSTVAEFKMTIISDQVSGQVTSADGNFEVNGVIASDGSFLVSFGSVDLHGKFQNDRFTGTYFDRYCHNRPVTLTRVGSSAAAVRDVKADRFNGGWHGAASGLPPNQREGQGASTMFCLAQEITVTVDGDQVSGEKVDSLGTEKLSGTIAADGGLVGKAGEDEFYGRFMINGFTGNIRSERCGVQSVWLQRIRESQGSSRPRYPTGPGSKGNAK